MNRDAATQYARVTLDSARAMGTTTHTRGTVTVGESALVGMLTEAHDAGQRADRRRVGEMLDQARERAGERRAYVVDMPEATPSLETAYGGAPGAPADGDIYATSTRRGFVELWHVADPNTELLTLPIEDVEALLPLLARLVADHQTEAYRRRRDGISHISGVIHAATHGGAPARVGYRCHVCRPVASAVWDALGELPGAPQ